MSNCAKVDAKKVNLNNFTDVLTQIFPGGNSVQFGHLGTFWHHMCHLTFLRYQTGKLIIFHYFITMVVHSIHFSPFTHKNTTTVTKWR